MGDFSSALDIFIIGCGLYMLYAAVVMRLTGEIKTSVLLSKNINLKKCRDLDGYKRYLFPRALVMSVSTILYGAAGMINTYVMDLGIINIVLLVILFAILIWYFIDYRRGIQKFWGKNA